jgi:hypothetical protein
MDRTWHVGHGGRHGRLYPIAKKKIRRRTKGPSGDHGRSREITGDRLWVAQKSGGSFPWEITGDHGRSTLGKSRHGRLREIMGDRLGVPPKSTQNLGGASHGRSREIHFGPCGRQKISGVGDHERSTFNQVVAKKSRGTFPWEITGDRLWKKMSGVLLPPHIYISQHYLR